MNHARLRQTSGFFLILLEPVRPTEEREANQDLVDMTHRLWVAMPLTAPVFGLEMGGHIPALGLDQLVSPKVSAWL